MPATSRRIKLGIIGCGRATGSSHLPALRHCPDFDVVAIADLDAARLQQVGDRFHIERRCAHYQDLLDDPAVEAVAVCVPAQTHVEVASAALDAGKHVFLEKPVALNLEETDRLIQRAGRSSGIVMLGFNLRWHRLARQARAMIQQGALGSLELVRSEITSFHAAIPDWRKRRTSGGGAFFEQAVHHFDLWRYLLRSDVEEVFATSRSGKWDDETAAVTARLENGVLVAAGFAAHTSNRNEIVVFGQDGSLAFSFYRFDSLSHVAAGSRSDGIGCRLREVLHGLRELPQGILRLRRGGDMLASFEAEWRHFAMAVREKAPVQCTLEDGRRALQVALAAARSAAANRPVRVSEVS